MDIPGDHARTLEREMLDAQEAHINTSGLEKDPLILILWRFNHLSKTLEAINADLKDVSSTLADHISREGEIKESIDDMVAFWKGSKLAGRLIAWLIGVVSALSASYVAVKKGIFS